MTFTFDSFTGVIRPNRTECYDGINPNKFAWVIQSIDKYGNITLIPLPTQHKC